MRQIANITEGIHDLIGKRKVFVIDIIPKSSDYFTILFSRPGLWQDIHTRSQLQYCNNGNYPIHYCLVRGWTAIATDAPRNLDVTSAEPYLSVMIFD